MLYVSDGTRTIYHNTNVQDFLIQKFGFAEEHSVLQLKYSSLFGYVLKLSYSFSPLLNLVNKYFNYVYLRGVEGLFLQEKIRKSYLK